VLGHDPLHGAQSNWVVVPVGAVIPKPASLSWEVAGGLYLAGTTAFTVVKDLHLTNQDVLVVSAAAGGVGHLECQLARIAGATVLGIAGAENHDYLRSIGVVPIAYGDDLEARLRTAAKNRPITAFIDNYGSYDALIATLELPAHRVSTSADRGRIEVRYYLASGDDPEPATVLQDLVELVSTWGLRPLISGFYAFEHVQQALADLDSRHSRGKVVVGMHTVAPASTYLGAKLRALQEQRLAQAQVESAAQQA
jgi:NADPH:quinone reductase-like Zn-dependent oxidoreductase